MMPPGLHVHIAGELGPCPVDGCGWTGLSVVTDTESTSARLRRVEQERDNLLHSSEVLANGLTEAINEREQLRADIRTWDRNAFALMRQRDTARAEVDRLRAIVRDTVAEAQWIVARDGGRDCGDCEREIRRNDAYSYNSITDELTHIHCRQGES